MRVQFFRAVAILWGCLLVTVAGALLIWWQDSVLTAWPVPLVLVGLGGAFVWVGRTARFRVGSKSRTWRRFKRVGLMGIALFWLLLGSVFLLAPTSGVFTRVVGGGCGIVLFIWAGVRAWRGNDEEVDQRLDNP